MKKNIGFLLMICFIVACNSSQNKKNIKQVLINEIEAKEVIHVSAYTYVRSEENGKEKWVAVPSFNAVVGETYYYKDGFEMVNFKSKELNRVFKSISFLSKIHSDPSSIMYEVKNKQKDSYTPMTKKNQKKEKPLSGKKDLNLDAVNGTVSIASLYQDLSSFEGKKVRVHGKVTKFSPMIMDKNWIHIQDGTDFEGEYDVTITSLLKFSVDDIVVLEATVAVDKDLGYGYKFKLLLEDAVRIEN